MQRMLLCGLTLFLTATVSAGEITWERTELDSAFRSEGVAIADVNKDGKLDVFAGDVWYEAPDWKMHAVREVGKFVAGKGYSNSFCNFSWDVNQDGWEDLILIGFPGAPFHWYENPQNKPGHWREHVIWHSACNESPEFEDLNGDKVPEIILGSQPEAQLGYLALPQKKHAEMKWDFRPVSEKGDPRTNGTFKYYHGLGAGDVNLDGRKDIMIPHGWWEAPEDPTKATSWKWHPWNLHLPGQQTPPPAANMYAHDLDLDGDQDIIMSSAHTYGIWWFEQQPGENGPTFKAHTIDKSYSQTHALEMVDINGDGELDLVTGKRYFAHNGGDPGGKDEVVMYWYEIKREKGKMPTITPHKIEAGTGTGIGTQFTVQDINGDKLHDIILSNKSGVNILVQKRK